MRRAVACLGFLAVAAATVPFVVVPTSATHAQAEGPRTILIPASDGYGFGDCLASGLSCGRVVADAWCEAHGFGQAISFGSARAEDVTASVTPAAVAFGESRETPIAVVCK